jgi:Hypothetical protein (DUF2513)
MKRDLDLIRSILLEIENTPAGQSVHHLDFEGIDPAIIAEHVELLTQANLIDAKLARAFNYSGVLAVSNYDIRMLTWEGHDFVTNVKNKTVWDKVKSTIAEKGSEVPFHVVKVLAANYMSQLFGII